MQHDVAPVTVAMLRRTAECGGRAVASEVRSSAADELQTAGGRAGSIVRAGKGGPSLDLDPGDVSARAAKGSCSKIYK